MKKLLLVCFFAVSIVSLSKAQGGGRMQRTPAEQLKTIQTAVPTLTADQSSKLLNIYTAGAASRDSLMKAGGDRSAMRPIMQAQQAKINAVLTADQQTTWRKYMEDMRSKMGGGMGGGGTPPPPQK